MKFKYEAFVHFAEVLQNHGFRRNPMLLDFEILKILKCGLHSVQEGAVARREVPAPQAPAG